jgi:hypothetical protein
MPSLNIQINTNSDDGVRDWNGTVWQYSNLTVHNFAGYGGALGFKQGSGLRFKNITIPQGATIISANLRLRASANWSNATVNSRIAAWDADNAPAAIASEADYATKWAARTTARVDWDNIAAWTFNLGYDSPDIASVIQEIVDRPGWSSGNNIIIFWDDHDNRSTQAGLTRRGAISHNNDSTKAPRLLVTYSEPQIIGPIII